MNKYIVKATVQILVGIMFVTLLSFATVSILEYFQPEPMQVVFALAAATLLYTLFNLIKIQADILESRDRLNK